MAKDKIPSEIIDMTQVNYGDGEYFSCGCLLTRVEDRVFRLDRCTRCATEEVPDA